MTSGTCARITWLVFESGREAYRLHRGLCTAEELPAPGGRPLIVDPTCLRCGGAVGLHGTGARKPYTVLLRDRGTTCRNVRAVAVHRGCVPRVGEQPARGIPARSRRASQVRARVEVSHG